MATAISLDVGFSFRAGVVTLILGLALSAAVAQPPAPPASPKGFYNAEPAPNPVPQPFPKGRYDQLGKHSPFSLATIQAPAAPQGPGFADNLYISGIARLNDQDFVTIKSRDLSTQFSLFGSETDQKSGISVASVNWSDTVGKSTVILRKGTETAKLEFNEAEIHATPQQVAKGPGSTPNGNLPVGVRPGALPVPPQGTVGKVPLPPLPNPNPMAGKMPNGGTPPTVRHRSQVIIPPQ